MRLDPDQEEEFVHSDDWDAEIDDLVYVETQEETAEGPRARMHSLSGGERNRLFLAGLDYTDVSLLSGVDCREDGRGFSLWDYNNDGYQDLVVISPLSPRVQVFRNEVSQVYGEGNGRIAVKLIGGNQEAKATSDLSNRDGVGAKVWVTGSNDIPRLFQRSIGEGFMSQNSGWIWVGMGQEAEAKKIEVVWPSGKRSVREGVATGTRLVVEELAE